MAARKSDRPETRGARSAQPRTCSTHGLGLASDGTCILCRRDARLARDQSGSRSIWLLGTLAVLAVLALGVLGGLEAGLFATEPAISMEAPPAPKRRPRKAPEPEPEPEGEEGDVGSDPQERPGHSPPVIDPPSDTLAPFAEVALVDPGTPAEKDSGAPGAPPSQAQVRATIQAMSVVMFSTAECPHCRRARAFLQANGIPYRERDIDRDPAARAELQSRSGQTAVPTLEIDGRLLDAGFSPSFTGDALAAAVERRLGVPGAKVRFKAGS